MKKRFLGVILSLTAATGVVGYLAGRARAAGVAPTGALTYSGVLTDMAGVPLAGSKNIQLQLWDDATAGVVQCTVGPAPQTLVGGGFQVTLPETCTAAVHAHPALWIEVFVDAVSVGRSKLGAVPYALEAAVAAQAADATGALQTTLTGLDTSTVKLTGNQAIAGDKTFSGNVTIACPTGMVDSGAGFCLDAADRTETAYGASFATCAAEGKNVCSFREMCTAKVRGIGTLGAVNYRFSDIMFYAPNATHYFGGGSGANGLNMPGLGTPIACSALVAPGPSSGAIPYRCCRSKG